MAKEIKMYSQCIAKPYPHLEGYQSDPETEDIRSYLLYHSERWEDIDIIRISKLREMRTSTGYVAYMIGSLSSYNMFIIDA